jgi:hypothetical protein
MIYIKRDASSGVVTHDRTIYKFFYFRVYKANENKQYNFSFTDKYRLSIVFALTKLA